MVKFLKIVIAPVVLGFLLSLAGHVYLQTGSTTHGALGDSANKMNFVRAVHYNAPFTSRKIITCGELVDCPSEIVDKQHYVYNWIVWTAVLSGSVFLFLKFKS